MSETAQSIIHSALQESLIQAAEEPIEASTFEAARVALNRLMATIPFNRLGFVNVDNANDRVTILPWAVDGVVTALALRLCPQFDIIPSQYLIQASSDAVKTIRKMTLNLQPTSMPETMSRGSGNQQYGRRFTEFYPSPLNIPEDAYTLKVGQIESYSIDFSLYLLSGATIDSFTIEANSYLTVLSSSESGGIVTYSVEGVTEGYGTVCVTPTTSNGRVGPETDSFNVIAGCP